VGRLGEKNLFRAIHLKEVTLDVLYTFHSIPFGLMAAFSSQVEFCIRKPPRSRHGGPSLQASASFGGYKIVIEQSRHQEFTVHRGWCRTLSADRAAANVQHLVGDRACSIEHEPGPPKRWVAWRSLSLWVGASVRNGRQPVIGAVPRQRAGQVRVTFSHLSQSSSTRRRVKIVSSALQSLG